MIALALALIGLPVGLALDRLIVRLAVPPVEDCDEAPPKRERPGRLIHAEAGAFLLDDEQPARAWARRLLVAGLTVALFAVAGTRYHGAQQLAAVTASICVLIVCAATDLLSFRIPNVVTYPAIVGALIAAAFMPGAHIFSALGGGALAGSVMLAPALLTGGAGMGMGDAKLATFVGIVLGFTFVVPALLLMAFAGGAVAAGLLLTGLRKRSEPIPYAPFISAGTLTALLWQGAVFASLH